MDASGPGKTTQFENTAPNLDHPAIPVRLAPPRDAAFWIRNLLACNPFYLVSAGLLLFGFYLVSGDANFPGREEAQFAFNFTSLQFYEVLLVGTAILLARRRIWYDSTLLVALENLLVLVPFVLITQAAWISTGALWTTCLVAGLMAAARLGFLKRLVSELNLPRGLLVAGFLLLAVNVALPIAYQHLNAAKVGAKPTEGPAYELNQLTWYLVLPMLIALANLLPRPVQTGGLIPQRRWLPAGLFTLWLAASTVHLGFLRYVYNFDWEFLFVVPPLWALAWTVSRRHSDFLSAPWLERLLLVPPALVTLLTSVGGNRPIFQLLTTFNLALYGLGLARNRRNWMALNLFILSLAALGASILKSHENAIPASTSAGKWMTAFLAVYASYWIFRSRNPKLGLFGAFLAGAVSGVFLGQWPGGFGVSVQSGLLFFLLHSIFWDEEKDSSAPVARLLGSGLWIAHSALLLFAQAPHAGTILHVDAAALLAVCCVARLWGGRWFKPGLPVAALAVLLLQPASFAASCLRSVPTGLWAIAGSLLFFACGTLVALTRSKWHHQPAHVVSNLSTKPTEGA